MKDTEEDTHPDKVAEIRTKGLTILARIMATSMLKHQTFINESHEAESGETGDTLDTDKGTGDEN
jgi:hypothetical protein